MRVCRLVILKPTRLSFAANFATEICPKLVEFQCFGNLNYNFVPDSLPSTLCIFHATDWLFRAMCEKPETPTVFSQLKSLDVELEYFHSYLSFVRNFASSDMWHHFGKLRKFKFGGQISCKVTHPCIH